MTLLLSQIALVKHDKLPVEAAPTPQALGVSNVHHQYVRMDGVSGLIQQVPPAIESSSTETLRLHLVMPWCVGQIASASFLVRGVFDCLTSIMIKLLRNQDNSRQLTSSGQPSSSYGVRGSAKRDPASSNPSPSRPSALPE